MKMQVRRRLKGQHDAWPDVVEASLTPSGQGVRRDRVAPRFLRQKSGIRFVAVNAGSATHERPSYTASQITPVGCAVTLDSC
jgi:hypothetical protein